MKVVIEKEMEFNNKEQWQIFDHPYENIQHYQFGGEIK